MENEFLQTEEAIVAMLKTVYDPEIPVNVYDLGMVYNIDVDEKNDVKIDMTLTAPNCPAADYIVEDVREKVESVHDERNSSRIDIAAACSHNQTFCWSQSH